MSNEINDEEQMQTPQHKRPVEESPKRLLLRNIMNLFFIVSVVVLVVLYFIRPGIKDSIAYIVFGMFAVAVKFAEMVIRFLPK